jgi:hypothetical protein
MIICWYTDSGVLLCYECCRDIPCLFINVKSGDTYPPPCVRVHCWHGWVGRAVDLRVRASAKVAFEKDHQSGNQWILQLCQTVEINHPCWCGGGSNEATIMPL